MRCNGKRSIRQFKKRIDLLNNLTSQFNGKYDLIIRYSVVIATKPVKKSD